MSENNIRIVKVWISAVAACGIITLGWYISLDIVTTIVQTALGDATGKALSLTSLIEYVAIARGPLFDVVVIIWAVVASQDFDVISRYS